MVMRKDSFVCMGLLRFIQRAYFDLKILDELQNLQYRYFYLLSFNKFRRRNILSFLLIEK